MGLDLLAGICADADGGVVVAEAAGLGDDLRVREHGDVGSRAYLLDEVVDELAAVLRVRIHLAEAADPAAELGFLLDEEHREADLGEAEGGAQAGDAAADHERARGRLHDDRLERRGQPRPGDAGADEPDRLARGARLVVRVRPGALLADVHLRVLVRVQAGALGHAAEGEGVQLRRAGGDDEAVELLLLDVPHDLLLRRVRAGEHGACARRRRPAPPRPRRRPGRRRRSRRCCRRSWQM